MKILIVTRGVPGAGKSFWIQQNNLTQYCLDPDVIRLLFQSPVLTIDGKQAISGKNDKDVWTFLFQLLEKRLTNGELTIIGGTHSKPSDFAKYKELIDKYRYRFYTIDFSDVSLEECLRRNSNRDLYKFVPEDAIRNIHSRITNLLPPSYANLTKPSEILEKIKVKPLDYNKWRRIFILGDVHGCFEPIKEFESKFNISSDDLVISVGDLFDRGTQEHEVLKWWVEHHNRPNFLHLDSNHHTHFQKYAFGEELYIKSNEFKYNTLPKIQKAESEYGYDKGLFRNLCRKTAQLAYFEYYGKIYLVTHGGISHIPKQGLEFVSSNEFSRGVGKYEDVIPVCESWIKLMPENHIQVFGHRNTEKLPINYKNQCFLLEGHIEFGGDLRILELNQGQIYEHYIKNSVFRDNLIEKSIKIQTPQTNIVDSSLKLYIEKWISTKEIYEQKNNELPHISSFNFKKDVFYKDTWNNNRELPRGCFVNNKTFEVLGRAYNKFFNLEEKPETSYISLKENLKFPVYGYMKYNGYLGMIFADEITKQLIFTSKSVIGGDFAINFERIFRDKYNDNITSLYAYLSKEKKCMVFEVIDPQNDPHIIQYNAPDCILLDVFKCQITPKKLSFDALCQFAKSFNLKCKNLITQVNNWNELLNCMNTVDNKDFSAASILNNNTDFEGIVWEDSDGFCFKNKTYYYRFWKLMRGIKDKVSRGHSVKEGMFSSPLHNEFYGFLKGKNRNDLINKNIIELRSEFETQNKSS